MRPFIDWFSLKEAEAGSTERERGRHRKVVAVLLVMAVGTAASTASMVVRGLYSMSLASVVFLTVLTVCLVALRKGASPSVVVSVVLVIGISITGVVAIGAGETGVNALLVLTISPILALPIGGRRAGWITLFAASSTIVVALLGIEHRWLTPFIDLGSPMASRLTGFTFVMVAGFLLTRAYEVETEASIRALEAHNRALVAAQIEATRASRAKSDFLAAMSHELRTPLNGLTGMVTLLRDETDVSQLREGLRVIGQSAESLLRVISDVLDFSKIEAKQIELESIPLALEQELRGVVELFQSAAAENSDELELQVAPTVPAWIHGDPTRLRQVTMNLVANAVKFTSSGRVVVTVSTREGRLIIEVTDTGIGMSKEVQGRLFAPFIQGDASTTRRYGGSGLGLVISRRLVEAMSGTLTLESTPGQGSCFTVDLPLQEAEGPPVREVVAVGRPVPRRVLVVEDNFVNQLVVMRLLQKLGHHVTVASNGSHGLELAGAGQFDVVLMDCHMPVMDGFEATRQLRARGDQTPIWALTAAATTEDLAQCLAVGMTGVLTKPLRVDRLTALLGRLPQLG